MKKLTLLVLVAAVGLLAFGCATSNYPIIIDQYTGVVENTSGKAMIIPTSQVATIWSDGADNLFAMIDQKADGSSTIENYNYYTTDGTYFWDTRYCSPDWTGCSLMTADNAGVNFVYTTNPNCPGYRSWSVTVSFGSRSGECGNATSLFGQLAGTGLSDQDVLQLAAQGVPENGDLRYDLNASTLQLAFTSNGDTYPVAVQGNLPLTWNTERGFALDFRSLKARGFLEATLAAVDALRADHGPDATFNVEGSIYGHDFSSLPSSLTVAFREDWQSDWLRERYDASSAPQLERRVDRR